MVKYLYIVSVPKSNINKINKKVMNLNYLIQHIMSKKKIETLFYLFIVNFLALITKLLTFVHRQLNEVNEFCAFLALSYIIISSILSENYYNVIMNSK
jgi:hypothetical protein